MQVRGCSESKSGRTCSAGGLVVQVVGTGSAGRAGSTGSTGRAGSIGSAGRLEVRVGLVWLVV